MCPNCVAILADRHPDVVEMDAASRTGVDDMREVIDAARYRPLQARTKVFIIDEVHMLSRNAFNALLKTLEEPPPHVKFIFATTEIRKVPVTVLSRCQRFDLRRISVVEPDPGRAKGLHQVLLEQAAQGLSRGKLTGEQADSLPGLVQVIAAAEGLAEQLDIVVESVPERLDLKRDVLAAVARRRPKVLATGTSALSVDELARLLPEPESFLGMHFFNPVWSLQLVELVRGAKTSQHTMDAAQALVTLLNKQSITVRDSPGFATSRLDVSTALEAIRMLEDGVASAEDIDTAMVVAYRHPMGPLRLCDIVGLDVRLDIARNLSQVYGERYTPPRLLIDKVEAGQLGVKSGQGFFSWP